MAKNTKAVTKTENREVAQQQGRNAYQQFHDETAQSGIEGDLLRFTKLGEWVAGQDQEELPEGTRLIMGLNTLKRGWQKWADNKPVDSRMGLVAEGFRPCHREELGDLNEDEWEVVDDEPRDPWQDTMQCLMLDPESGQVYTYATSSKSGKTALGEVSGVYGDRLQDGEDPDAMPIVVLGASSYKHKQYGKVMIPVFEMTDEWVKPDDIKPPKETKAKPTASRAKPPAAKSGGKNANGNGAQRPQQRALPAPRGATKTPSRGARI